MKGFSRSFDAPQRTLAENSLFRWLAVDDDFEVDVPKRVHTFVVKWESDFDVVCGAFTLACHVQRRVYNTGPYR